MGGTRGKRVPGKKKPKSVKAKVTSKMSSKRRLSRMGKELKKGQKGIVANYMTRSQVLRRLQITLRDFRRLCILKGIYPRDPKKKASGKDKAYYHIKDVGFLSHEPLLNKFREFKAFMKKVRKAVSRGDKTLAEKREATAPQYTLDHLVRERYPRFDDALGDLDDALSLVHLFATLPADGPVQAARTERCRQLALEWQYYVARAHALTKVFVSVKGVYFQAEVGRQPVTWIVPHAFTQVTPPDVDFRIMLTFLEFYETLLKFTLFKLYHRLDVAYPPAFDGRLEECGVYMAAVRGLPLKGARGLLTSSTSEGQSARTGSPEAAAATPNRKVKGLEAKLARLAAGKGEAGGDAEGKGGEGRRKRKNTCQKGRWRGHWAP
ncbi:hypothetical protein NSK_004988 [Nannochloropsis salina CCMP1776]|uniref:Pescadillo homolog n=1 Tax=Nannochloropsis salina CCMP1776 TaxID=1027361 RepID=A0A4D9CX09_9STRA|nr:hypothetical protein NSK_004988 [Nannochloropsis salina CCMP1776]|eukprot:TFJ83891.1 hypothetical protein NSK_004988 [Nannochloropsis salina CCMP1776]